jgi:hypothetical protein
VAYLLLSGATFWGLVLSSKIVQAAVPAALALALHLHSAPFSGVLKQF